MVRGGGFVFNLASVNRPQNTSEFMEGNFGFASTLLDTLRKHKNTCPVMLSSSQQASLTGRFLEFRVWPVEESRRGFVPQVWGGNWG